LSTFVGRVDDLERGARLLGESRLVTFTGAGGCGKTRLARQVAVRVAGLLLEVAGQGPDR
jgi:predicted ATPase